MSDPGTFCSDCAWPYECAREQACHRRDQGDIRARDYRELPQKPVTVIVQTATGFSDELAKITDDFRKRLADSVRLNPLMLRGRP